MLIRPVFLTLGLSLLSACALQPSRHDAVQVSDSSDCPIRLAPGQVLTVQLASNPSTGYRWHVQQPASDVLASLGPEVYSNPEDIGLVGSSGQSQWRFQAKGVGAGKLVLFYQQPWALEVKPVETFECSVSVR